MSGCFFVGWLVALRPSNMLVYLMDGYAQTSLRAAMLGGLVVGASASREEDPGFESRLRRDFFGVESYQ